MALCDIYATLELRSQDPTPAGVERSTMAVETKREALALISQHSEAIRAYGVKRCGIFGSVARDETRDASDVDILVEFEPNKKTFRNFMGLADYLEELLGRPVDLVTAESLSPYIGPYILQEVLYAPLGS